METNKKKLNYAKVMENLVLLKKKKTICHATRHMEDVFSL